MAVGELLIDGSSIVEEYGKIRTVTASILVNVTTGNVLAVLYGALNHVLVPKSGDAIDVRLPNVVCVRRTPTIVGQESGLWTCKVICEYEWQEFTVFPLPIRGGASLSQVTTQKDRYGVDIKLQYKDDEVQAEVTVPDIRGHFAVEVVEWTNDPWSVAEDWVNHVNSTGWKNGGPGEWLCTDVQFQQLNINTNPKAWTFQYEFERNPTRHEYTIAYKDKDGNIPADVVTVNPFLPIATTGGIKTVQWHLTKDFWTKFG